MMRNACGSNDHPDPIMFTQVFRLLCCYSLVKPPKGSNVSSTELLKTLIQKKEFMQKCAETKNALIKKLDTLLESQYNEENLQFDSIHECHLLPHNYDVSETSEEVQTYIAGYVARKASRLTRCEHCIERLKTNDICDRDKLITLMDRFNQLIYPSKDLFQLTKKIEQVVLYVVGKLSLNENTIHLIFEKVAAMTNITFIGCNEHKKELTKKIINFYLVMRAYFLAASYNEKNNEKKIKTKNNRKNSKF